MNILFQFHIIFSKSIKSNVNGIALGMLGGRGGISLLRNEDKPIFRGYALPDQPELLVQAVSVNALAMFGKCMPGKYCNDY